MDLNVLLDSIPVYAQAAVLTIQISAAGIALSLVVGTICAAVAYFRIPVLHGVVAGYIENGKELRTEPCDLQGNPEDLVRQWLA